MRRSILAFSLGLLGVAACGGSSDNGSADMASSLPNFGALARGGYLMKGLVDCAGCHTSDPTKLFAGGNKFDLDNDGHYVYSRNLTPDPKTGLKLTEEQFLTVMRTGEDFHHPGTILMVMPWANYRWMSTDDLKAIYAVLQQLPAVENEVPDSNKGPFATVAPIPFPKTYNEGEEVRPLPPEEGPDPFDPTKTAPVPDPGHAVRGAAIVPLAYQKMPGFFSRTAAEQASFGRGAYLVNAGVCSECHTNRGGYSRVIELGADFLKVPPDYFLTGGTVFAVPPSLNPVLKQTRTMAANLIGPSGFFNEPGMTYLKFAAVIQTMSHADDDPPMPLGFPMPASSLRTLSADDLLDIYTYLKILAEEYDRSKQVDKVTQSYARYCTGQSDCGPTETCFVDASSDKKVNNQCVGRACESDDDCDACQKCSAKACVQPSADDACLRTGR